MFLRIAAKAMTHRRKRLGVAAIALIVGSTVTTAMLSVYYDAGRKMNRELRAYGANIMVSSSRGSFLDQNAIDSLAASGWPAEIIGTAPFLYVVAQGRQKPQDTTGTSSAAARSSLPESSSLRTIVVTGTWVDQARKLSPWWHVRGNWIESRDDDGDCLIGTHLANQLGLDQKGRLELSYGAGESIPGAAGFQPAGPVRETAAASMTETGKPGPSASAGRAFTVVGILDTGGPEDDQVVVSLKAAQELAALPGQLSAIAISASGGQGPVEALASQINLRLPGARADLVRQIAESEGRVLGRLRLTMLLLSLLILTAAVLSVGTTLTALVMDRRKEIGTMKAIGAEGSDLLRLFMVELMGLGLGGGIVGFALGMVLAQPIGRSLFSAPVTPRFMVFLMILIISLAVALLSAVLPIRRIRDVEPALILKGD
jgi:putative ABC transport system permease protein